MKFFYFGNYPCNYIELCNIPQIWLLITLSPTTYFYYFLTEFVAMATSQVNVQQLEDNNRGNEPINSKLQIPLYP